MLTHPSWGRCGAWGVGGWGRCGAFGRGGAIARILRQEGLTKKRRKKRQKKNDLCAVKAQYRVSERLQADTKPLCDIPAYRPQMQALGLPLQHYTVRDVKSGALFIDYADELSTTYALMATRRILEHPGRSSRSGYSKQSGLADVAGLDAHSRAG